MDLELCAGQLDRMQVRAVGRQEEEPCALVCEALGGVGALMDGEIVEDDDIALRQHRCELGLDVEVEGGAIHGLVDDPWCSQSVAMQAGYEALGSPVPEGRRGGQPFGDTTARRDQRMAAGSRQRRAYRHRPARSARQELAALEQRPDLGQSRQGSRRKRRRPAPWSRTI